MDVGLLESGSTPEHAPDQPAYAGAKGYSVTYREVNSGHEYVSWRGTLADGLITLIGI